MKTVSVSPDLFQLAHDWIITNPTQALPAMAVGLLIAISVASFIPSLFNKLF